MISPRVFLIVIYSSSHTASTKWYIKLILAVLDDVTDHGWCSNESFNVCARLSHFGGAIQHSSTGHSKSHNDDTNKDSRMLECKWIELTLVLGHRIREYNIRLMTSQRVISIQLIIINRNWNTWNALPESFHVLLPCD